MKNELKKNDFSVSLEIFPPKKEEEFAGAFELLDKLALLNPDFISVTYGAGGSRSKKTVEMTSYIKNTLNIPALAHLTCVGNTKNDIDNVVADLKAAGINNVLALRGDRPAYMTDEQYNAREFEHASDMIAYLKETTDFKIAGACYPEKHFEAFSFKEDVRYLKQKVDLGVEMLISQLFFDNEMFYRFEEMTQIAGINVPICAGIMPITTSKQLGTTVSLSGSSVPKKLADIIATYDDKPEDMRKAGIEYAVNQILDLKAHGVKDIHLYSMNKAKTTKEIFEAIR
ncbi:MAG: methylenetetrahydrofolate reductase [NAD(P)H] [Lachnospiraceae bacterium]|nr:methylenetetrahydrofolate reductase [NAD(P)H] [Lachnospiraceae bacterium]